MYFYFKNRTTRALIRNRDRLWEDGIVYYKINEDVNSQVQDIIADAILEFEQNTCLQFRQRTFQTSYVEFISNEAVCSSSVGKVPNEKQYVKLGPDCWNYRIVLHEIGHAIGMWHEQSRPDRDDYVEIFYDNIRSDEDQFTKRTNSEAQSEGIVYDYASIMHYPLNAFSINEQNSDFNTIGIINDDEYNRQGRPRVGYSGHLSDKDIQQVGLLYACQYASGTLSIYARRGHNLPDEDSPGESDPYLKIVAYKRVGASVTRTTEHIQGNESPVWNEWLNFGTSRWVQFTIQAFDSDWGRDDHLSVERSYYLDSFTAVEGETICVDDGCDGYFTFDYYFG